MVEGSGYQLVVIGASAGGIDALSTLVGGLPADFPVPVVIAQHLHPNRQSNLSEILGRRARLPVRMAADRTPLAPGVIFVVPVNRNVEITDHQIRLRAVRGPGPRPSVDRLLTSAAAIFGEHLIGVILTGSGSDGASGARDVKVAGGTVIIQNPETASYPSMPRSLAPTSIDFVSEIEDVGPLLHRLVTGHDPVDDPNEEPALAHFLEKLRQQTGIDFNTYKRPTIVRRLRRRMAASGQATLPDYARYVEQNPDEYQRLTSSFLIKVTEFFRDPKLFDHLRTDVLPTLIAEARKSGRQLRVWSAGCSTGEETYSLAILVAEALGDELDQFDVRIFATDVDTDAIAFARRGTYPASAVAKIPEVLRERYFVASNGEYELSKKIRVLTIFGQHDLGVRAPFPRIDLILCRNVLIYFTADLQKRALQVFAFSLRPGGRLVLGASESVTQLAEHFQAEDARLKVFRREGGPKLLTPVTIPGIRNLLPRRPMSGLDTAMIETRRERDRSQTAADQAARLIQALPIGVVVVDAQYDIRVINGAARRLLSIHGTAFGEDFIHLAESVPASPLRAAIDAATRGDQGTLVVPIATIEAPAGEQRRVELTFEPLGDSRSATGAQVIVTVTDATAAVHDREQVERLTEQLTKAVESTRRLLTANDQVTTANAELRTSNEEFLLSSEEAQSGREEVETLNEELQATNEELETLNEELQASVEELNTANEDIEARSFELREQTATLEEERSRLSSILGSMGDAVLAVDRHGGALLTNEAYRQMFPSESQLHPEDEAGRPLAAAERPENRAATGEAFSTHFTLTGPDGNRRWFEANAHPIDRASGSWGGVVVIRDITDRSLRHLQEQFMAAASHELRTPIAALQGYLQLADRRLRGGSTEDAGRYLDEALRQTGNLADLVSRLFEVAQIETGRLKMELQPVDLEQLVRRSFEIAQVLEDGVTLELKAAKGPIPVQADAARLEQVVFNLINNAVIYGAEGGRVEIRLGRRNGRAHLDVQDFGAGIPPDDLPRLFQRFSKLDHPRGPRSAGLGLGLYLSREIVTAHGGTIEAHSTVGSGTTITVRLPVRSENHRPRATRKRSPKNGGESASPAQRR